ncbi:hypothetical protein NDU88_007964 [Pleurodeles waltl]|uniref:Uncharacterized protein n=1 Tax=Pleurodeles waltl TaxID=8319 RepID=A0AAV7U3Y0_PLEWA|nr:hypothetical protein NDU88_007964 [Pleurodeles waltl]
MSDVWTWHQLSNVDAFAHRAFQEVNGTHQLICGDQTYARCSEQTLPSGLPGAREPCFPLSVCPGQRPTDRLHAGLDDGRPLVS